MGRLSLLLPDVLDAVQDWNEAHPAALREVMENSDVLRSKVKRNG